MGWIVLRVKHYCETSHSALCYFQVLILSLKRLGKDREENCIAKWQELIWHCKDFFSWLCVSTALSDFIKRCFFCFLSTFGLHFRFQWVTWQETIPSMQLHQVTSWPSHYTSLAVCNVSWSFLTLTSALTSKDESHLRLLRIALSSQTNTVVCTVIFHFHTYHYFYRITWKFCHSDKKADWFAFCGPFAYDVYLYLWTLDIVLTRQCVTSPLHNCLISLIL